MPRFFCTEEQKAGQQLIITGEDARHIGHVLRMKVGEAVTVSDNAGTDYECKVAGFEGENVLLDILEEKPNESEPSVKITLYQAMPKSDKFDFIVQKAVELGAVKIVPVLTRRCVSRPDGKSMKKKQERYQKIAKEAAKQCGRGVVPEIGGLLSFEAAVKELEQMERAVLFYEKGGRRLNDIIAPDQKEIGILIGSEGGFEEEEVSFAKEHGIEAATLGKLILRCETAPLASISILMNLTGNI